MRQRLLVPADVKTTWGFNAQDIINAATEVNLANIPARDGHRWEKVLSRLTPTQEFRQLIAKPNHGRIGKLLQKTLARFDNNHPLLSKRYANRPPTSYEKLWGFTAEKAKATVEGLDRETSTVVSYRFAASHLGNDRFRAKKNAGQGLKKVLMKFYKEWTIERQSRASKQFGGNPGRRRCLRVTEEGIKAVPEPPSRAISESLREMQEECPELREEMLGTEVTVGCVKVTLTKKVNGKYKTVVKNRSNAKGHIYNIRYRLEKLFRSLHERKMLNSEIFLLKIWFDGSRLGCVPAVKGIFS